MRYMRNRLMRKGNRLMRNWVLLFIFCAAFCTGPSGPLSAQTRHSSQTAYPTCKGLVMAGYQGWFRAAGDGSGATRFAYGDENRSGIDLWPDVSEYTKTYETPFKLKDGSTARFFSSYDKSTVDLHFKWMRDYGVDGVFMQRFFNDTREGKSKVAATTKLSRTSPLSIWMENLRTYIYG